MAELASAGEGARPLNVGVLLSGCGVFDGTEVQESTLALLALDRHGATSVCLAPDRPQQAVVDHLRRQPMAAERNMLQESARIARGKVAALSSFSHETLDALIIPGGHGVGKSLCSYLVEGVECAVYADVAKLIGGMLAAGKPIGAICLAPVLVARVAGARGLRPRMTIGCNEKVAADLVALGAEHVVCDETGIVVDEALKIVSTPAYMCATRLSVLAEGIEALVARVIGMAHAR